MKLLFVEDDAEYALMLSAQMRALDHAVTVADNGRDALVAMETDDFDAVILDCMLPQMDGTSVVQTMRQRGKAVPVLMLSALGRSAEKIDGLEAGADDYVVKPTPAAEIDARLRALVRGRNWSDADGDALRAGDILISPGQHRAWRDGRALDLSNLEFRLLAELVRNAGSYLSRQMLVERVWGYDFVPTSNIVDGQIKTLRRRLTAGGASDPIVTKRGVGYMLPG